MALTRKCNSEWDSARAPDVYIEQGKDGVWGSYLASSASFDRSRALHGGSPALRLILLSGRHVSSGGPKNRNRDLAARITDLCCNPPRELSTLAWLLFPRHSDARPRTAPARLIRCSMPLASGLWWCKCVLHGQLYIAASHEEEES